MSQDQHATSQVTMTTECPVCGVHAWVGAPTCPACGTALGPTDPDDLFTTVAVDNAEVVPAASTSTRDQLWAVVPDQAPALDGDVSDGDVSDGDVSDGEVLEAEVVEPSDASAEDDGDLWEPADTAPPAGGAFSPEPTGRPADVLDVEEVTDDDLWDSVEPAPPAVGDRPLFAAPEGAPVEPVAASAPEDLGLWDDVDGPGDRASATPPPVASAADPHGLSGALERIGPEIVDRAAVPLAVASVLLEDDEVVEAAVVGEMLGHPASIVLTGRRVVVANGRRWSPVVDVFPVDAALDVRGRHDGGVAALTLMDADRIVTVDGIADVPLAMHFADLVRSRTRR